MCCRKIKFIDKGVLGYATILARPSPIGRHVIRDTAASEPQLPGLSDEIMPEALMRFLPDESITGRDVDLPGGVQHVVRPQDDLPVSDLAGESGAFLDQPGADSQPASRRLDQQEAEFRHALRLLDQEDRADVLPVPLGDPAARSTFGS